MRHFYITVRVGPFGLGREARNPSWADGNMRLAVRRRRNAKGHRVMSWLSYDRQVEFGKQLTTNFIVERTRGIRLFNQIASTARLFFNSAHAKPLSKMPFPINMPCFVSYLHPCMHVWIGRRLSNN